MTQNKAQLIVALDVSTLKEVRTLMDTLSPVVDIFKVGSQLFTSCGPTAVRFILSRGKRVFLDLKYHDIPNTVARAVEEAVGLNILGPEIIRESQSALKTQDQGVFMYTLHILGGKEMLQRAIEAAENTAKELKVSRPLAVGITVLTSQEKDSHTQALVLERARLAKEVGLDGVVASVDEAEAIRREMGDNFIIVTPGIRPQGADAGDQKRLATPKRAVQAGSNFLVVGRPIIESDNPLKAAQEILEEIKRV